MSEKDWAKVHNNSMRNEVIKTIEENGMLNKGDKVIVALSGGPDSISLLHVLSTLIDEYNIKLYAAHVNHMLRSSESDEDEATCRRFCQENNIEFFSKSVDINYMASENNISTEMAGRDARYEFFADLLKKLNANKVALAHNLNDQAETVLMRLMRGTGIEGLIGIKPVRDEVYIRPIINVSRQEIEGYCKENNLPARIDHTNYETIYSRNKIRLELIPYIQQNFNSDIITTLNRMCELIKRDEDYIQENVIKVFQKYCDIGEDKVIIYKDAFYLHPSLVSRVIRKALLQVKGDINNIQSIHIDNIINLQKSSTGKFTTVPKEILIKNVYGNIEITMQKKQCKVDIDTILNLNMGNNYIEELGLKVYIRCIDGDKKMNFKSNDNIKYFNGTNIKNITLRFRKNGDRFSPLGMKGSKKLKDIFIDLKIPREERDLVPLLCFDEDISWIIGYKISDKFKIHEGIKNIIEVRLERQEKHE
ncbi:tRNA lysidine(34) synthetase TilS [uncultured Clostridium sp.]|uniref:tRNA lysidine(34) synthetase TilS n=1 Tax=uncultured Clostridium sp. TaxID=59620 RepID=UPI003217F03F